jgi:hypothetical protein
VKGRETYVTHAHSHVSGHRREVAVQARAKDESLATGFVITHKRRANIEEELEKASKVATQNSFSGPSSRPGQSPRLFFFPRTMRTRTQEKKSSDVLARSACQTTRGRKKNRGSAQMKAKIRHEISPRQKQASPSITPYPCIVITTKLPSDPQKT